MSAAAHKWGIVRRAMVSPFHSYTGYKETITSRHKTEVAAKQYLTATGGTFGGFSVGARHVRRLTKKERGLA